MVWTGKGRVHGATLVLDQPPALPDGTEVIVSLSGEVPAAAANGTGVGTVPITELPFFGMWADREDMEDSAAWVNRQRDAWSSPSV